MSAEPFLTLGLHALEYAADNDESVYNPLSDQVKRTRSADRKSVDDISRHGIWKPDERGLVLKRRSEVESDEEIVDILPKRRSKRGQLIQRTSSLERGDYERGNPDRSVRPWRGAPAANIDVSDRGASERRSRPKSRASQSRSHAGSKARWSTRSNSTSSADLGSSSGDEKRCRRAAKRKWITACLAGVTTVHAAAKVYRNIKNHDKRVMQVQRGEMSPEEANKKEKRSRWQDAAGIAIAALGIKGARNEWRKVQEQHREHEKLIERRQEMHQRRMEREHRHKMREARDGHPRLAPGSHTASSRVRGRRGDSRDGKERDGRYYDRFK